MGLLQRKYRSANDLMEKLDEMMLGIQQSMTHAKIFLFTSVNQVREQPFIVSEIAAQYARQGKEVLLIDANFYSPSLHSIFKVNNQNGLSTLLLGDYIEYSPLKTNTTHLSLLPSGPYPKAISRLLLQQRFDLLLEMWWKQYDYIFINSAPVIEKPDTKILAGSCDAVILCVRKKKTKRDELLHSIEILKKGREKYIGTVFIS